LQIFAKTVWAVSISLLLIVTQGCSVVGLTAGAIIDRTRPNETEIKGESASIPREGKRVRIVTNSDEVFVGKVKEFYPVPESLYSPQARYRAIVVRELSTLPTKVIVLETVSGDLHIVGRDIKAIYKFNSKHATEVGVFAGLAIDIWLYHSLMRFFGRLD
jgi:hypothetical protein